MEPIKLTGRITSVVPLLKKDVNGNNLYSVTITLNAESSQRLGARPWRELNDMMEADMAWDIAQAVPCPPISEETARNLGIYPEDD